MLMPCCLQKKNNTSLKKTKSTYSNHLVKEFNYTKKMRGKKNGWNCYDASGDLHGFRFVGIWPQNGLLIPHENARQPA